MSNKQPPVPDKWRCLYCGEVHDRNRGVRPVICPNPNCLQKNCFEALTGPWVYFTPGRDPKFVPKKLADDITKEYHFATHRESWLIYCYDDGVYLPDGRAKIRELAREHLGELAKNHHIIEVEMHIQDTTFKKPEEFEPAPELICVKNGMLNTVTKELKPHAPDIIFLSKLPAEYNPEAKCPVIIKRFHEWTGGDMKQMVKLVQFAGFCLYRNYFIRKAIIIHGEGNNGKTTYVLFMTQWLGEKNVASVKVQKLEKRFTAARLFGKLANLCDDLPGDEWFQTGSFKQATGGSPLEAEKKFKDEFLFCSYAKMLFTGNRMPIVSDDTQAFWDRIALISFGEQFVGDRDKNRGDLLNEMLTDGERSGFLSLALEGLDSLLKSNEFHGMDDMEATKKKYVKISDPVMAFGHERTTKDLEVKTEKRLIYADYVDYCRAHGYPIKENNAFARSFKRIWPHIEDCEDTDENGRRFHAWLGVALVPKNPTIENFDNLPQDTRDTHVSTLYQSLTAILSEYKLKDGVKPVKRAEPAETLPPCPLTLSESAPTDLSVGQGGEPTAQDIEQAVYEFRKTQHTKAELAKLIGVPLKRLKPVLEKLEREGAVRDMGSMVEVV